MDSIIDAMLCSQSDRLTDESSDRFGSYNRSYALDAAFNRTGATGSNGQNPSWSRTLTGNSNNQITGSTFTQNGTTSNTYDGEGNRTSVTSGDTTTFYDFDAQQRLSQVRRSTGGAAATVQMKAGYSSDGLRAWKEDAQGVRTYFLYDGDQLVGEFDQSGVLQASQTWGAEGLSYRRTASGASAGNRFYSWDVRGNVAATTDSTGAVVNTPSSDGFSSSGGTEPCATFGGQVGGYRDSETGLVLFGQRYYDSSLGSWLTRDPIAENRGINLYSYVQGNPTNWFDEDGLAPEKYGLYAKINPKTGKVYIGRTSGQGTLDQMVAGRNSGHHMNTKGYGRSIPIEGSQTTDRAAIRGLEQRAIDHFGGAISDGGSSGNAIRGIGLKNLPLKAYLGASQKVFGKAGKLFGDIDKAMGAWGMILDWINPDDLLKRAVNPRYNGREPGCHAR